MAHVTLNELLLESFRRFDKPDLLWHKQGGEWKKIPTRTVVAQVVSLAQALQKLGLRKGERVGLLSENRPEWQVADLACLGLGLINVPLYPAESVERLRYILGHSEARLCFLSGPEQFEKVRAAWPELPALEKVVTFLGSGSSDSRVLAWRDLVRDDTTDQERAGFERAARAQGPDDVCTLIYTSGTTGQPKGALLTQHNFGSNVLSSGAPYGYAPEDLGLCLLPLCHVYERTMDYIYLWCGVSIAYAEGFERVAENLLEVRPTMMAAVPRFFEKFYTRLMEVVQGASAPKRKLFEWAVRVGRAATPYRLARKPLPAGLAWRHRLAEALVYSKIRAHLGGRFRFFISGSAPLSPELNEFFHAVGFTIYEGYGLTETSPVITSSFPGAVKLGTVGRPIEGVEVKIAEDGEVLTRGPHVMKGYYKAEEATREALRDGWFHTGDLGARDAEGFLTITGRKKDLIKTAGGKMIAPQLIENRLKASSYIETAVVIGDRRKYAVALLVPRFANLERYAESRGIPFGSRAELLANPEIQALVQAEVDSVNRELAQYERIKRFAVLDREFSFDGGQLTYTQKVRRQEIEKEYHALIEQLYQGEASAAS